MENIFKNSKKIKNLSNEDVKLFMVINDKGGLRYLDFNGIKKRYIYAAQLAGVGRWKAAFYTIIIADNCRSKSTGSSAEVDQQVINLIAGLRVYGSERRCFRILALYKLQNQFVILTSRFEWI